MAVVVVPVAVAVAVVLLSASPPAAAQPWQYCGSSARYSPNSTYQINLEAVSAALPRNASSSPALFATAARGAAGGDDSVFALTLCRGDADAAGCLDCVADAFRHARGSCPLDKEVAVLYDACFLYFSGQDFLATTANVGQISLYNTPQNASADPRADALFTARVRALLNGTARWAAYGSARRFATARIWNGSVAAPVPTMYALAQCTPDLSPADCWGCLEDLVGKAPLAGGTIGARTAGVRCSYRYENYAFFRGAPMLNMGTPPPPSTQPTAGRRSGKRKKQWILSILVPLVGIFLCIFCFGWIRYLRKGRLKLQEQPMANLTRVDDVSSLWTIQDTDSEFTMFDFRQIVESTDNFCNENKLGQGGFGAVYKVGQLPNGLEIAVKRLAAQSGQGFVEFKNEIHLIAKLQHTNLVRLLGCCVQGEEHILIYEYMQNKSLDFFIFDVTRARLLTWAKRLNIIEGIAQGLLYLHKLSRLRIIHRDLKASNILLDSDMNPKISDFGLAKVFSSNAIQGNTNRVVGTYGYMAPEYASEGVFSVKTDVFSFGVLLLEIISGKRNAGFHQQGDFFNLLGYAWKLWKEGRWFELLDKSLADHHDQDQALEILKCINIALMCVQENGDDRPTMSDVVAMLSMETMSSLPCPKQPAYFNLSSADGELSTTAPSSVNVVSVCISEDPVAGTAPRFPLPTTAPYHLPPAPPLDSSTSGAAPLCTHRRRRSSAHPLLSPLSITPVIADRQLSGSPPHPSSICAAPRHPFPVGAAPPHPTPAYRSSGPRHSGLKTVNSIIVNQLNIVRGNIPSGKGAWLVQARCKLKGYGLSKARSDGLLFWCQQMKEWTHEVYSGKEM